MMGVLSFQKASKSVLLANIFSVGEVQRQAIVKLEKLVSVSFSVFRNLEA